MLQSLSAKGRLIPIDDVSLAMQARYVPMTNREVAAAVRNHGEEISARLERGKNRKLSIEYYGPLGSPARRRKLSDEEKERNEARKEKIAASMSEFWAKKKAATSDRSST